ncbi:glycosyltransferase [Dichotomopilus funicola]|uniref:Glycosyltransferase n=1 Tax=Dichotomopilus funicola TaxID=1934379 RepID=A0AAN6ZLJ1_9PEZI|nr:glycosyltransferase [Dichotomopilus funicola]
MLAHQCSARAYIAILIALILSIFLLTANRLNNVSPISLPHFSTGGSSLAESTGGSQQPDSSTDQLNTQPDNKYDQAATSQAVAEFCNNDWKLLRRKELGLTNKVAYTRRCIKPTHNNPDREAVGKISDSLVTGTVTLNLKANCEQFAPPPCEPLELDVPPAYAAQEEQYNHLLFGIASSYERIQTSLPVFAQWLAGTGAQLLAVVADADEGFIKPNLRALEAQYRNAGVNASIIAPKMKESLPRLNTNPDEKLHQPAAVEQLHFLLIRDMLDAATPQTKWLGVLDDDTFFPAMDPLSVALSQYDHTKPMWLGALADNWISMKIWGFMAYGGAGTFLSVPLAKQLEPHLEDCVRQTDVPSGDGMLRDCMYTRTTTKLTVMEGLYQHDIRGDASGFFESGRRTLSIHHWKSWYHVPIDKMAAITSVCGDCFLQRWRFGSDTLFANGYSITQYREGLDNINLDLMEATFEEADSRFDFVYGPFRPRLDRYDKKSYRLVEVDGTFEKGGQFKQLYVYRATKEEGSDAEPVDEVVELIWDV